ncbi:MAG: hypothetical protein RSD57_12595 [Comamonas sp.]
MYFPQIHLSRSLAAAVVVALAGCQITPAKNEAVSAQQQWTVLQSQVGRYQNEAPFLQHGVMATKMQHLLGDQAPVFLRNLEVAGPLQKEGSVYYITGNRQHEGGSNAGAVALDAQSNTMRIWWQQDGQPRVVQDPGAAFKWPSDVNQMISNAVALPAS